MIIYIASGGGGRVILWDVGFLSQFEVLTSSTTVEATLGPDVTLGSTSVLDETVYKWGPASMYLPFGVGSDTPATITAPVEGLSWRVEMWIRLADASINQNLFNVYNGSGVITAGVTISSGGYVYTVRSPNIGFTSANVGGTLPSDNEWFHIAIEQPVGEPASLYTSLGFSAQLGTGVHEMDDTSFQQIGWPASGERWIDSALLRWFEPAEEDLLYFNSGYIEPTGPFEPPDYVYSAPA